MFRRESHIDFDASGVSWNYEPSCTELFQTIDAALYTTDADGWLTYYNDAAAALWGFRPTLGRARWSGAWRLDKPDGTPLPHNRCPMAAALKQARVVRATEVYLVRPDGSRLLARSHPTLLRDAVGAVTAAFDILLTVRPPRASSRQTDHCVTASRPSTGLSVAAM